MTPTSGLPERFLNVFQGDIRSNILGFSRRLWEDESDVFIFMARKAACLFDCLRELNLASVRGLALNDRVLDMDLSFLSGKRVALVDDCIFTGTTLYRARKAVTEAQCSQFSTLALAVNMDSIRPNLLPGGDEAYELRIGEPLFALSDSDCVRQCYDVVRAVSLLPRPYDVDFPHSLSMKLKDAVCDAFINMPGWTAHEVSSESQRANQVHVFSLIPISDVHRAFCGRHACRPEDVPMVKIRLYARRTDSSSWTVRVVPMVVLPIIENGLALDALQRASTCESGVDRAFGLRTPQSRYRLLHFMIAHSLLNQFARDAERHGIITGPVELRRHLMEMSFGIGSWELYIKWWPDPERLQIPRRHPEAMRTHQSGFDGMPVTIEEPANIAGEAYAPFTWLYKEREIPAREFVRDHGLQEGTTNEGANSRRLLEGFSIGDLLGRIQSPAVDTGAYLSLLLDRGVDFGVVVPTMVELKHVCCRAFRHGEDAILSEAQERLLLQMVQAYMEAKNITEVWGLELQKLLVLMVQIGIRNNLMERLNMLPAVPVGVSIVSLKGHLHGLVPTLSRADPSGSMGPPYVAGHDQHPRWLLDVWVRSGRLSRTREKKGSRYAIAVMPKLSMGVRAEAEARLIGRCLGTAYPSTRVDSELVLLSTCAAEDDQVRALSGEIAIFRERWPRLADHVRKAARDERFMAAHKDLRAKWDVFAAINSGAMKYNWYVTNAFAKTVQRVDEELRSRNHAAMADQWVLLWPEGQMQGSKTSSITRGTISKAGQWLVCLNVAMRILDYWIVLAGHRVGQCREEDVQDVVDDLQVWCPRAKSEALAIGAAKLVGMIDEILERIGDWDDDDAVRWCHEAGEILTDFARGKARGLLDDATIICNAYGAIDVAQTFPYAVYLDVDSMHPGALEELHRSIDENIALRRVGQYFFLPDNHNPWRIGRWVLFPGNRNAVMAGAFCRQVTAELLRSGVPFRGVVLGQLSTDDCIRTFVHSSAHAEGHFFRRITQLREDVLPRYYKNEIGFANEVAEEWTDEVEKYRKMCGSTGERPVGRVVKCGEADVPVRNFIVTQVRCQDDGIWSVTDGTEGRPMIHSAGDVAQVLICSATDSEDDAIEAYLSNRGLAGVVVGMAKGTYRRLGEIDGVRVFWVRSSMGSDGTGGALLTTVDAIDDLKPDYVISCGVACGHDSERQKLGEVLVAEWVRCYEKGRVEPGKFVPRGDRVSADPFLVQMARVVRRDMEPIRMTTGGILSGEKLVDDPEFKRAIWSIEPEAIGADMEGSGILDACVRRKVRWTIVKAICDWGEDKNDGAQAEAAGNAIEVVFKMIGSRGMVRR